MFQFPATTFSSSLPWQDYVWVCWVVLLVKRQATPTYPGLISKAKVCLRARTSGKSFKETSLIAEFFLAALKMVTSPRTVAGTTNEAARLLDGVPFRTCIILVLKAAGLVARRPPSPLSQLKVLTSAFKIWDSII